MHVQPRQGVMRQRARLAALEARIGTADRLTVAEAREVLRLREMEARRRADMAWRARGDNAERGRARSTAWRRENPGMSTGVELW